MADHRRSNCMSCGRHKSEVGEISWRGNCVACGEERQIQNYREIVAGRGPMFRRWARNLSAGVERKLLDDHRTAA